VSLIASLELVELTPRFSIARRNRCRLSLSWALWTRFIWRLLCSVEMMAADITIATHDAALGLSAKAHGLTVVGLAK